jgi:hypothetical protein
MMAIRERKSLAMRIDAGKGMWTIDGNYRDD